MIIRDPFGNAPTVSAVVLGGTVPDTQMVSVDACFSEDKHDMVTLTYSGFPGKAVTDYRGLPVIVTFGNNEANMITFCGYVAYVDVGAYTRMGFVNESMIQEANVVCFGTSYDMRQKRSYVYRKATLKTLVSTLAKRYRFSYSVPSNPYVFPTIDQSNKSDWETLVTTAAKLGYCVTASNAHLNVYDPFSSYYRGKSPTTLRTLTAPGGTERTPGNIFEFNGSFGDVTPEGTSDNYILKALDQRGKPIKFSTSGYGGSGLGARVASRFTHEVTLDVNSQETLRQFSDGYAKADAPFNAVVSVAGISTLLPGSIVIVDGYNSEFDGYWIVEEARHLMNTDHYVTYLKIKTDSTNKSAPIKVVGSTYQKPPGARLSDRTWISERESAYVY